MAHPLQLACRVVNPRHASPAERPNMSPKEFAAAVAHGAAAEFVRYAIPLPDREAVGTAILEDAGVRIVISITRYEGPARLHLTPEGAAALGMPLPTPATPPLTTFQRRVLDVLDMTTPRKAVWIAHKLGMKCSGGFRGQLGFMVRSKMIRNEGGYLLMS